MKTAWTLIAIFVFAGVMQAQIPDFTPPTPLIGALMHNDTAQAKRLLAAGADPNEAQFLGFPPVFLPVRHQNLELVRAMAERGADVRARDLSGSTALMWAAFSETDDASVAEELLRLGVDATAQNKAGETASTWARKRGHTTVLSVLENGGASKTVAVRDSAERALTLLQKSGTEFLYLLRTQFADGSWLVRTRTFPFQRYKESGFPHGKDQWISAAGTSWAAMALSLALPSQK